MTGAVVSGVARVPVAGTDGAVAAVLGALTDAGLAGSAVEGVLVCGVPALEGLDLGFELSWAAAEPNRFAVVAGVASAAAVVSAGLAAHVVCVDAAAPVRFLGAGSGGAPEYRIGGRGTASGWAQWHAPYGADSVLVEVALAARAYVERFGLTRAELAQVALAAHAHVGDPLGLAEYLAAPMLADPLCRYDRATPVAGAAAIVLSDTDLASDLAGEAVAVAGLGSARSSVPLWEQQSEPDSTAIHRAAERMWRSTGLAPADVDVAVLGDELSFLTVLWLEALGFCGTGEARYLLGRKQTSRGLEVAVNPHGGQLGAGGSAGLDLVVEAVAQLRGGAPATAGAQVPAVAAVGLGEGTVAGCLLLTR